MASFIRGTVGTESFVWFCLLVGIFGQLYACHGSDAEDRLLDDLLEKNLKSRPAYRHTDTVRVVLGVALRQIVDVDEIEEKLVVSMWRRLKWTDYRLMWNESDYDGIDSVTIPLSNIWTPDVVLDNSVETEGDPPDNAVVSVSSSGRCSYYPFGVYSSQCPMDIRWFPLDDQFCNLDFISWSYDSQKMNISIQQEKADLSYFKSSTEWDLVDVSGIVELVKYECCETPYSFVSYTIHLKRKVLYYVFNLICPCALISFITCLAFFLPIDSGERTGLCITTLLALTVYQIIVLDKIPASSESTPLIGIFFITLICINTAAMLMSFFTINLHHRTGMFYRRPPVWIRKYICYHLARYLFMTLHDPDSSFSKNKNSSTGRTFEQKKYLPTGTDNTDDKDSSGYNRSPSASDPVAPRVALNVNNVDEDQVEEELVEKEWKYTALVLDRACFFFFIFVLLFSSACIFLSAMGKK